MNGGVEFSINIMPIIEVQCLGLNELDEEDTGQEGLNWERVYSPRESEVNVDPYVLADDR